MKNKKSDNKFANKSCQFYCALCDCYKDEEDRESPAFGKLDIESGELTEDFTALLAAMKIFYEQLTDDKTDLVGFTHILNRLAIQHITEPSNEKEEKEHE